MGLLTLGDLRKSLSRTLGNRGLDNEDLDLFIHLGYIEVATRTHHESLLRRAELDTIPDEQYYDFPDALGIDVVKNTDSGKVILKTTPRGLRRRDASRKGEPLLWARVGRQLQFWPTPTKAQHIEALYVDEPARMDGAGSRTAMSAVWDGAVYLMSVHYALSALDGLNEESMGWYQRAERYIGTRLEDADYSMGTPQEPLQIARSFSELFPHHR
jgi:hypothetical protein